MRLFVTVISVRFSAFSSRGIPMPSRTSHFDAQHSFDSSLRCQLISQLPSGCQGKLLVRRVRLSITYPPRLLRTQFDDIFSSCHLRDGVRTCNGLSKAAGIVIGVVICMYRPITSITLCTNLAAGGTLSPPSTARSSHSLSHLFHEHVRILQTTPPAPNLSSPRPTDAAGRRGRVRGSVRPRWCPVAVLAAVSAPGAQWPRLAVQL